MSEISLGEFINKIKEDLESTKYGTSIYYTEKIELEVHVTVTGKDGIEGGVKVEVEPKFSGVSLGKAALEGKGNKAKERQDIHTVKITLTPIISKEEFYNELANETKIKIKAKTKEIVARGDGDD